MALAAGRKHNEADRTETRPEADTGKYVGNRGGSLRHDGLLVTRLYMVQTCVRTLVGADRLEIPLGRRQPRRATKTARIPTITATRMPFYDFTPGIGLKAGMIEADRMRIDRLDRDYHPDYTHGARGTDPQRARHLAKTTARGRSGSRLTNQRPAGMATAASTHEDLRRPRRKTTGTDTQTSNTESSSQTRPSTILASARRRDRRHLLRGRLVRDAASQVRRMDNRATKRFAMQELSWGSGQAENYGGRSYRERHSVAPFAYHSTGIRSKAESH